VIIQTPFTISTFPGDGGNTLRGNSCSHQPWNASTYVLRSEA